MIDIDLVVSALRRNGHSVETVFPVPENAGDYELSVDGNLLNLRNVRQMLDRDHEVRATRRQASTRRMSSVEGQQHGQAPSASPSS